MDLSDAVKSGRTDGLSALVDVLVDAIAVVDDAQVSALAARLVDVLRRIGGDDVQVLFELRDKLARCVKRVSELQGEHDEKTGRALGTELAALVSQLVAALEAIAALPTGARSVPAGVVTIEEAKRLRAARQQSAPEVVSGAAKGGRQRR